MSGYDPEVHGPKRVVGPGFHGRVYRVVQRVPPGRVTTFGDVAAALGLRSVARKVGHALAAIPEGEDVPWFRVVNAKGVISSPSSSEQAARLRSEGVEIDDGGRVVEFKRLRFEF